MKRFLERALFRACTYIAFALNASLLLSSPIHAAAPSPTNPNKVEAILSEKMNDSTGYRIQPSESKFLASWTDSFGKATEQVEAHDVRQGWSHMVYGAGLINNQLKVKDTVFGWGLAGHADSQIDLVSPEPLKRLRGAAGIESNENTQTQRAKTKVTFSVLDASKTLWASNPIDFSSAAQEFDIPLSGQKKLTLRAIADTPAQYGHINWGGLIAETTSGKAVKIGLLESLASPDFLPIDFIYGNESMHDFIARCGVERQEKNGFTVFTSSDSATGFTVEFSMKTDADFPACEWHLSFENRGTKPTRLLHDVKSLHLSTPPVPHGEAAHLLRGKGAFNTRPQTADSFKDSFMPVLDELKEDTKIEFGPKDGRCSEDWLPFFNLKFPTDGGLVFAIGWAGHWTASVSNKTVDAGLDSLNARLLPGEKISLPSIYLFHYEGKEPLRGNNILRRFLREKIAPRYDGKPIVPPACNMAWGGLSETAHLDRIKNIQSRKLPFDVYWVDAGWYAPPSNSEHDPEWSRHVGNWNFNPELFPNGTKPVSDAANKAGIKFLLWVEPERAIVGTRLPTEHPDWFLGERKKGANLLLNLGDTDARNWCIDYVSRLVETEGVDVYREDFNINPLAYWRSHDAPDRQGITEIKAIEGLYSFWSELRRRFPKLVIDNCASGGRRIDIELLRYSVPLWSSDMQCYPGFNPDFAQTHVSGLSYWLPLFGNGIQNHEGGDTYNFRSNLSAGINVHLFYQGGWPISDAYPYDWLKERLEEFHAVKDSLSGDYYPLISEITHSPETWSASQYDRPDMGCGALIAFRREASCFTLAEMRLKGLQAGSLYEIHAFDSGKTWTAKGSELMEKGIRVEMPQPRSSRLFSYKVKEVSPSR